MKRALLSLASFSVVSLATLVTLAGCGRPFDVKTAPGFVELENQTTYDYRATTPEGVVVSVRVVEDEERGDLTFWQQAILLQLRDVQGYALLEATETASADGTKGRLLKFGRDEDGKPYAYWISLYLAQGRLFIVEAGGAKDIFEKSKPSVEWAMKTVKVKCSTFPAPVLASRTCNRW